MQIFVHRNGEQLGPFTEAEVQSQLTAGALAPQDLAWWEGQGGWTPLVQTRFLGTTSTPPAAPVPGMPVAPAALYPTGERTSGMAIASMVCGIVGFIYMVPAIVAVVLGHISRGEMKRDPALRGRGMALAGLILGYFWIFAFIAIVGLSVLLALGQTVRGIQQSKQLQQSQGS